jgi:hypothetical protein
MSNLLKIVVQPKFIVLERGYDRDRKWGYTGDMEGTRRDGLSLGTCRRISGVLGAGIEN